VVPYYNKPSQEGVLRHFSELNRIGIPLMLYNIPGRTGINISPDTIRRIADVCENLVAVKAANGNLEEISDTYSLLRSGTSPSRPVAILSGDDALTLPILSVGGVGVVSVIANVLPRTTATLVERFAAGDVSTAQTLHHALLPLAQALLRVGPNPEPIKALMSLGGIEVGHGRLPLVPPTPNCLALLRTAAASTREALRAGGFAYEEILDRINTDTSSGNQTSRKPSPPGSSTDVGARSDRGDNNRGPLSFASAV
jgi:4-hydroxy-tetrahydrodipicolinate synthase